VRVAVATHPESATEVLLALEGVLREEHAALRVLDRERIEQAAERKLELDERLRSLSAGSALKKGDLDLLRRVREAALKNQLLIVHARACVQGVLSMVAGDTFSAYPGAKPARVAPAPLRLDVRG
jgi:hypothetical protein